MSEPYLGEIKIVGFDYPPRGWAFCNGQLIEITQNQSLFAVIGTIYGGNGRTNFALPDLRGRAPIHKSDYFYQGLMSGLEKVKLTIQQMPSHTHGFLGTTDVGTYVRTGSRKDRAFATSNTADDTLYGDPENLVSMHTGVLEETGGGQAHNNMQPYIALGYIIATSGLFPPRD